MGGRGDGKSYRCDGGPELAWLYMQSSCAVGIASFRCAASWAGSIQMTVQFDAGLPGATTMVTGLVSAVTVGIGLSPPAARP